MWCESAVLTKFFWKEKKYKFMSLICSIHTHLEWVVLRVFEHICVSVRLVQRTGITLFDVVCCYKGSQIMIDGHIKVNCCNRDKCWVDAWISSIIKFYRETSFYELWWWSHQNGSLTDNPWKIVSLTHDDTHTQQYLMISSLVLRYFWKWKCFFCCYSKRKEVSYHIPLFLVFFCLIWHILTSQEGG